MRTKRTKHIINLEDFHGWTLDQCAASCAEKSLRVVVDPLQNQNYNSI